MHAWAHICLYTVTCPCSLLFSFFFFFNDTATTEIYTLSLHDALPISGTFIVATVKSGGNKPSALFNYQYEPGRFVSDNVTPEKAPRGYTGNPNLLCYEGHGDLGGPLIKDRVWGFGSYNYFKIDKQLSGVDPKVATDPGVVYVFLEKTTWKISDKDKLIGFIYWGNKQKKNRGLSASTPPESVLG